MGDDFAGLIGQIIGWLLVLGFILYFVLQFRDIFAGYYVL